MKQGEEFREDQRRQRPLPASLIRNLTHLSPWHCCRALSQTIGAIAVLVIVSVELWTPWLFLPAIVVMAGLQHALFVLVHDAVHYRLFENRPLNDLVGRLLAIPIGISMYAYRAIHRLHHNHLYTSLDPDMALQAGYPRGRAHLIRKLLRDLVGLTAFKTFAYFFGNPAINKAVGHAQQPLNDTSFRLRSAARHDRWFVIVFHLSALTISVLTGAGWYYLVLWLVPLLSVIHVILRLRAVCEHGAVNDISSPLTAARTNRVQPWIRWWLFPHHVHYHIEHHLYPSIPHYRLPQVHDALRRHQGFDHAEVRSLTDTLRLITSEPSP